MMVELLTGIQNFLRDDTGASASAWRSEVGASLGDSNFYIGVAPDGTTTPYATYFPVGGESSGVFGTVHDTTILQINFWGDTALKCYQLADAFDGCLNRAHQNVDGGTVDVASIRRLSPGTIIEDPEEHISGLRVDYEFYIG